MSDPIRSKEATRARILEAAEQLLLAKSAQFVNLSEVAADAGISPALIVRYFNSKTDLFIEAGFNIIGREIEQTVRDLVALNPAFTLGEFIAASCQRVWATQRLTRDIMSNSWWWHSQDEARLAEVARPHLRAVARGLHTTWPPYSTWDDGRRSLLVGTIVTVIGDAQRAGFVMGLTSDAMCQAVLHRIAQLLREFELDPLQDPVFANAVGPARSL
jgi:AcrR family transcriptional regulator